MGGRAEQWAFALRCAALRFSAAAGGDPPRLLPESADGWRIAAELNHELAFTQFARHHAVSMRTYVRTAERWLRTHTQGAEVRLRMRAVRFEDFLASRRYRTQFELPMTMSGGAQHRALRMILEHTVLGVPTSARAADRPIYAYLSGSDEAGQIQQYGEVMLRLKGSTRRRSTFMLGDSLDHALSHFREPAFAPCPLTRPRTRALLPIDVLQANSLAEAAPPYGYAEAQLYGGLRPQDIEEVVYTLGTHPSPSAVALLDRLRVQWSVIPGAGP